MFKIGYREGRMFDDTRTNWAGDGPRPLVWAAWYPTTDEAVQAESADPSSDSAWFHTSAVAKNARISSSREVWPVVLLSHGTGGSAQGLDWLGARLAAQGFICIGVSHHGNTSIEPYLAEGFLCWWERSADLTKMFTLLSNTAFFSQRIDVENVFAAGFSLGGHTVVSLAGAIYDQSLFDAFTQSAPVDMSGPREFPDLAAHAQDLMENSEPFRASFARHADPYRDHRIKAIVSCAPAPTVRGFTPQSVSSVTVPTLILSVNGDTECPPALCADWLLHQNPDFRKQIISLKAGHYVFLPEATEYGRQQGADICVDLPTVNRRAIHDITAQKCATHFSSLVS